MNRLAGPLSVALLVVLAGCAGTSIEPEQLVADNTLAAAETAASQTLEPIRTNLAVVDRSEALTAFEDRTTEDRSEDPNRMICRRMQRLGTHRKVRVCYTQAELDAMHEQARKIMLGAASGGL